MLKNSLIIISIALQTLVWSQQTTPVEWSKNATIYEVNIRQFTNDGTFKAFEAHLPRLKAMGVDILWLMPIHPIGVKNRKGTLGSYYAIQDYTAVNPEFGTKDDFQSLVNAAHKNGLKIIIDWVANHTSPDSKWVAEGHTDWYTLDSLGQLQPTIGTDWWDVADLNYDNQEMRKAMIDAMKYWVKEFNIDGYRCDVADWVPVDFWNTARKELDAIKPVFMLAEAENPEHHKEAFDMSYAWELHHIMNDLAKGKKSVADLKIYLESQKRFPSGAYRMAFTSNHDENSWNGTEMERMGDARFALAVFSATFQGMPLIYNGQETSLDRRLQFFEKDSIVWDKLDLVKFYTTLNNLNHKNKALWNGDFGGKTEIISPENENDVLVFVREKDKNKVLVIINLSDKEQTISLQNDRVIGKYKHVFTGKKHNQSNTISMTLKPWEYHVFAK